MKANGLVGGVPLWKIRVHQLGWWLFPTVSGKIRHVPVTTNQMAYIFWVNYNNSPEMLGYKRGSLPLLIMVLSDVTTNQGQGHGVLNGVDKHVLIGEPSSQISGRSRNELNCSSRLVSLAFLGFRSWMGTLFLHTLVNWHNNRTSSMAVLHYQRVSYVRQKNCLVLHHRFYNCSGVSGNGFLGFSVMYQNLAGSW